MTPDEYRSALRQSIMAAKTALNEELLKPYWPDYQRRITDLKLCLKAVK